jgi:pilus assembly protein CpaB
VVIGKTATLELSPSQSETLALARQLGTISLALRSLVDSGKGGGGETKDDSNGRGINVVRFGVSTTALPK